MADVRRLLKQARATRKDTRPPAPVPRKLAKQQPPPPATTASKKRPANAKADSIPAQGNAGLASTTKRRKIEASGSTAVDTIPSVLPSGFFDAAPEEPAEPSPPDSTSPTTTTSAEAATTAPAALPSDFFDTPTPAQQKQSQADLDKEYALFQKAIEEEVVVAGQIEEEEEEDEDVGRDVELKVEQMAFKERLEELRRKRAELEKVRKEGGGQNGKVNGKEEHGSGVGLAARKPQVEVRRAFDDEDLDTLYNDVEDEDEDEDSDESEDESD
ncbi:hypothetical protein HK104_006208 [Borealophlyctis nickersoniae]|nr:hypothetical protein HK104_006208 [Borealophlyctis nickersoniae]